MEDRMNVPKTYQPVLPEKMKAHLAKQQQQAAQASEGQTIWYQCVDHPDYWSKDGHRNYQQAGVYKVNQVLEDPDNDAALMVTFQDNRLFKIVDGGMLPSQHKNEGVSSNQLRVTS